MLYSGVTFEEFAASVGAQLRAGLVAGFGPNVGVDAAAEALAYAWEHWSRVSCMDNPAGYLYRVGQTAARTLLRPHGFMTAPSYDDAPGFEPGLAPALESLSESQRVCVVMVHGYGWSLVEVAELLDVSTSTVRTHLSRALQNLQRELEVTADAD